MTSQNRAALAAMLFVFLPWSMHAAMATGASDPEEVVITATRVEQPISRVIGAVTVITRADIERRQPQSLQDLLRGEAGVEVANQGGLGKLSSVFVRGANASQMLVLVDGVRLGSATAGTTAIEFIPVEQIERVEIVRGPRSSLYGSDAIGGVLQIFTRQMNAGSASAGYGTHGTQSYSAGFGAEGESLRFSVSGSYLQSDGFNACTGNEATFAGCAANEPDKDGYRNSSASARLGYSFGRQADLEFSALHAMGYTAYDGFFNQTRFRQSVPTVKLRMRPTGALTFTVVGAVTDDRSENLRDGVPAGHIDTRKNSATVQTDWQRQATQLLSAGVDYVDDRVDSDTRYARLSRHDTGVFAQYQGSFNAHETLLAIRREDNQQFGTHTTGNVGWKWFALDRALTFNAGWGSAFRAPTFNDLYYPFGLGNPDLRPERSQSFEAGASGDHDGWSWSVQGYQTEARDLIVFAATPVNISKARMRGLELGLRGQWQNVSAALNYNALDPRSRQSGATYDRILARRARHSGRVELTYSALNLQFGSTLNLVGARYDDLANTVRLGGYTTVDVTAALNVGAEWSVHARLANVFDRSYETARYYNQDGRNLFVSVRYRPADRR